MSRKEFSNLSIVISQFTARSMLGLTNSDINR